MAIELGYSPEMRYINWHDDRGKLVGLLLEQGSYAEGDSPMTEKMVDDILAIAEELGEEAIYYKATGQYRQALAA